MTKERAKELLEEHIYFSSATATRCDSIVLPIVDVVVVRETIDVPYFATKLGDKCGLHVEFQEWTFKGLLKIAYDLKDND